jgi:hypothetical protein
MVDGRLIARLDDARVSFCLIGDRARAVHGCAPRSTDVELLTLDETVLRPLFWDGAPRPRIEFGGPDGPWMGRLLWDGTPLHRLIVGRDHATIFAADTAKANEELGCRVATPLGLVLLALDDGGPRSVSDVLELVRAQEAQLGQPWRPAVEQHLAQMPSLAAESWRRVMLGLGRA